MMRFSTRHYCLLFLVAGMMFSTLGCSRYLTNRYFDARDMAHLAVGVTHENSQTGIWPPALGIYLEATEFLHLGAITYHGTTAELDMRGSGVYNEDRGRLGLLWWQWLKLDQDYREACYTNYFKTPGNLWEEGMTSPVMYWYWKDVPAKDLTYQHWRNGYQYGTALMPRGYQYWEYIGAEVAICDPFITKWGLTTRAGFDLSEASDFLLGWFGIDFKRDDMDKRMYEDYMGWTPAAEIVPGAAPKMIEQSKYDKLAKRADRLAKANKDLKAELEKLKGELTTMDKGVEIVLPDTVLFKSGSNVLTADGKALLDKVADTIKDQYATYSVTVEGHTDSQPIVYSKDKWKDNWGLSANRALSVLRYLVDEKGLPKEHFNLRAFADNLPVASNDTPEGRKANRRSMIVLRAAK